MWYLDCLKHQPWVRMNLSLETVIAGAKDQFSHLSVILKHRNDASVLACHSKPYVLFLLREGFTCTLVSEWFLQICSQLLMSCQNVFRNVYSLFERKGLVLVVETVDASLLPPLINLINCCHITAPTIFLFLEENI